MIEMLICRLIKLFLCVPVAVHLVFVLRKLHMLVYSPDCKFKSMWVRLGHYGYITAEAQQRDGKEMRPSTGAERDRNIVGAWSKTCMNISVALQPLRSLHRQREESAPRLLRLPVTSQGQSLVLLSWQRVSTN